MFILNIGTTLPLVGASQGAQGMPPLPPNVPSAAVNDIAENIRAKIYALCTKIGVLLLRMVYKGGMLFLRKALRSR